MNNEPANLVARIREPAAARTRSSGGTVARGHGKADVAVRGPAVGLLLVLTRRLPPSAPGIEVLGEHALLAHWLEHTPF